MPHFAAAVLLYSQASDDAFFVAVDPRSVATHRAPRLEELIWSPADVFDAPSAAAATLARFAPRLGNTVLQTYVIAVRPFLLDDDALIAREVVRWSAPAMPWFARGEAA